MIALDSQVVLKYIDCDMPFRRMTIRDRKKTKAPLIENLAGLCDRLAAQTDENTADAAGAGNAPRAERDPLQISIWFIDAFGLIKAKGIDQTESGIGFKLESVSSL